MRVYLCGPLIEGYSMVAAGYAAKRSQLVKDLGLGRKGADVLAIVNYIGWWITTS